MKLYGYWRSSASYRVRLALHLKGVPFDYEPVHLVRDGGEQHSSAYRQLNPAELVPTLEHDGFRLNQSLAIIDYLDQLVPEPLLVPTELQQGALVRMLAMDLAAELQPVTNLRVLQYLTGPLGVPEQGKIDWIHHWIKQTFGAFEQRLGQYSGHYCVGDQVSLADVCLLPQVYNAHRFGVDLAPYPYIRDIHDRLQELPAVQRARPEAQSDAEA